MTISSPQQGSAAGATEQRLRIDVWSDLACPWCGVPFTVFDGRAWGECVVVDSDAALAEEAE